MLKMRLHAQRFPGIAIEASRRWTRTRREQVEGPDGRHVSIDNFDKDVYYFVKGVVGKA